jgi:hypothetical protein
LPALLLGAALALLLLVVAPSALVLLGWLLAAGPLLLSS